VTVLAYKDGILAADTQLTDYSEMRRAQKIVRLKDGGVAGGCGEWKKAWAGLKWLADGEEGEPPSIDGASLMIVRPDGTIWLAEDQFPAFPLMDDFAAVGCGSSGAMMAMRLGLSAVKAVEAVTGQDAMCGGSVQSLEVVPMAHFPAVKTHRKRK
jgi:hypothetical protein